MNKEYKYYKAYLGNVEGIDFDDYMIYRHYKNKLEYYNKYNNKWLCTQMKGKMSIAKFLDNGISEFKEISKKELMMRILE